MTLSNRNAGVPIRDIESMTGMMINTVPRRVILNPEITVLETLRRIQSEQLEISKHETISLIELQSAGIPVSNLLNTILNFWGKGPDIVMKDAAENRMFARSRKQAFGR